jgi:hypothetical protein
MMKNIIHTPVNEFKNTYVVESGSIVYFKKEKHGELGGAVDINCTALNAMLQNNSLS